MILKVKVAGVEEKAGQLPLGLDVKVGELDHGHCAAVQLCLDASFAEERHRAILYYKFRASKSRLEYRLFEP